MGKLKINRLVKNVSLGPRQMTFGFEDRTSKNLAAVFSSVKNAYQSKGPVPLDSLLLLPELSDQMAPDELLQTVFWLAQELKLHFFCDNRILTPDQAKQILLTDPDHPLSVVINKNVDERQFKKVKEAFELFLPDFPENMDQYSFSRLVAHKMESWRDRLESYAESADRPFYPGSREIKNGRVLLDKVLEKQDAYTLIGSCLRLSSKVVKLAETVSLLTKFYRTDIRFWQALIDQLQVCESHLTYIESDKEKYQKYCRLKQILKSQKPYPLLDEARLLFADIKKFNQIIEQEILAALRKDALEKSDKMIKKMLTLFEMFESDREYRNHCLHELRQMDKRIQSSSSPDEIRTLINDAKDIFVDLIEEM